MHRVFQEGGWMMTLNNKKLPFVHGKVVFLVLSNQNTIQKADDI